MGTYLPNTGTLGWGICCGDGRLSEAGCCLFERIYEVVKHDPRQAIHMEKLLFMAISWVGQSLKGSNLISKVGQTVLARLTESQIRHLLVGSVAQWGKGSEK